MGRLADLPIDAEYTPNGGNVPRLSGDIRHLIPKLGLREYWYPLCGLGRVRRKKPLRIRMLGEDLCVFRGTRKGEVYALTDICPHRGARLSEGDCHYAGTVACPYHGWVFDGSGMNVAVLSEGPNSLVCGKPGTEARAYPTRVIKGIVFVWMGDGEPAPIEEDVPEEFFRDGVSIFFNERIYWRTNWEVALENSMDSHVQYLHRDNLQALLSGDGASPGGGVAFRAIYTGNGMRVDRGAGFGAGGRRAQPGDTSGRALAPGTLGQRPVRQAEYEQGWRWPKHLFRRWWRYFFNPIFWVALAGIQQPVMKDPEKWVGGHHLPGMFRAGGSTQPPPKPAGFFLLRPFTQRTSGLFALYTRQTVPVDEWRTRVWYHHSVVTTHRWQWLRAWFGYFTWGRWQGEYNFSQQDMSVMLNQVYDAPEKLSGTDAEVVQWRRLVVTKHFGGRDHPFEYENAPVDALAATAVNGGSGDG
jgi:phenylpropionate dioxygenase-like ring-hydroxylating dioxygenase large terminal subunit